MAAPAAALHLLTPGSPAYALAKVGAVGGLIALKVLASRRQSRRDEGIEPATAPAEPARTPHPVSSRKRKRRRR